MTSYAFVFPGQGSQAVGMLDQFIDRIEVQQTLAEASEVLDYDMRALVCQDPRQQLNTTFYTQTAMLTADIALYRAWLTVAARPPSFVAGHSLGEYAALVAAQVLCFTDALALVKIRAQAMQTAVPEADGKMFAVLGLTQQCVTEVCQGVATAGGIVSVANINAPEQMVISGQREAVEQVAQACKALGAKRVIALAVSVPAHSPLMQPAAEALAQALQTATLHPPQIPVVHNVDVCCHQEVAAIKKALIEQVCAPVRWVESVDYLCKQGMPLIVECGPGRVLTGLGRRINKQAEFLSLADPQVFATLQTRLT